MLEGSSGLSGHGVKLQMLLLVCATLASHPLGLLLSSLGLPPQNEHGSRRRKSTPMISAKTGSRSSGDTQTHDLWSLGSTDSSQGSPQAALPQGPLRSCLSLGHLPGSLWHRHGTKTQACVSD